MGPVTENTYYICSVTFPGAGDEEPGEEEVSYGSTREIYYYIDLDNKLTADAKDGQYTIPVAPGGKGTLQVEASCLVGSPVYQWYDAFDNAIDNATESAYEVTDVTGPAQYRCLVTDEYRTDEKNVYFNVVVDTGLTANALNNEDRFDVAPGSALTLTVVASAYAGVPISYSWVREDMTGVDGNTSYWNSQPIAGENGPTLQIASVDRIADYECVVSDDRGNEISVCFYVRVKNDLTAEAEESTFLVTPGGSATFRVNASCANGGITYTWFNGDNEKAADNVSEFTVTNVTENAAYFCVAQDMYGNYERVTFRVICAVPTPLVVRGENEAVIAKANDAALFSFTPSETGDYVIWSEADDDTCVTLYDAEMNELAKDDDGGDELNFRLDYHLTAGTLYYYLVRYYHDTTGSFAVRFIQRKDNGFSAYPENRKYEIAVPYGQTAVLKVEAHADEGSLRYVWYDAERNVIADATGNSCVTVPVERRMVYECVVSDEFGNRREIDITVSVDNGLTAEAATATVFYALPGESVTMRVSATALQGPLTYRWVDAEDWTTVEGAAGESLTVENINEDRTYYCRVIDPYGTEKTVWFYIYVDNGFNARAKNGENRIFAAAGERAAMEIEVSFITGDISCRWYVLERKTDSEGRAYSEERLLEGETGRSCRTLPVNEYATYICRVTDAFGDTRSVYFYVTVTGGLMPSMEDYHSVAVPYGQTAVLTPDAEATAPLTYKWFHITETEEGYISTELETASSGLTVGPVTGVDRYECYISDPYGITTYSYFYVSVDTGLTYDETRDATVYTYPGGSVELTVNAAPKSGCTFTYQWRSDSDPLAETGKTLRLQNVTDSAYYYCMVSDGYGGRVEYYFNVVVTDAPVYRWSYDAKTCTAAFCPANGAPVVETVTVTRDETPAGCETAGEIRFIATFTNPLFEAQSFTDPQPRLGHLWSEWSKSPSCTEPGDGSRTCARCNKTETRQVPASGHDWGEPTYVWAADHSTVTATRVCRRDATHVETETVAASYTELKAAACTEPGEGKYVSAAFENPAFAVQTDPVVVAAPGHDFSAKTATADYLKTAATCASPAVYYKSCVRCGLASETDVFTSGAAAAHDWGAWTKLDDARHQRVCKNDAAHKEAALHTWNAGEITKPATVAETGVRTYTCTACGAQKTEEIPKLTDAPVTATDPATGVSVTYDSKAYSETITVRVVVVDTPEGLPARYEKTYCVDVSTYIGSKEAEPKSPVTVSVPVPAGFNANTLKVFHVKDDGSVEEIAFKVSGGKITFTALAFSVYAVADTSTEVKEPAFKPGDVDGDGDVDTSDARLALRSSIGLEKYAVDSREHKACDVNRSGEVETADARFILRHAIGLTDPGIVW